MNGVGEKAAGRGGRPAAPGLLCVAVWLALIVTGTARAMADPQAAWDALRAGQHVALMRHAATTGGLGDPPGWTLADCATQRNLSAAGREDARRMGLRLKSERVRIGRVLASPWCRCLETARLLDLGPVEAEATFSNAFVLAAERDRLAAGARSVIAGWAGPGTLLIVTHGSNIAALVGVNPQEGEIVVVERGPAGVLKVIGRIAPR